MSLLAQTLQLNKLLALFPRLNYYGCSPCLQVNEYNTFGEASSNIFVLWGFCTFLISSSEVSAGFPSRPLLFCLCKQPVQTTAGITKQGRRWVRERHHKRPMEKQMPLEEVLAFSPAQIHGCFLALGYCWRGLVFHHSFIRGNLPFLLGQKPAWGPLPALALVSGSLVWPRGPHTPLCHSTGAILSNGPPQLEKNWISNLLTVPSTWGTEVLVLLSEPASNVTTHVDLPAAPVSSPVL